MIKKLTVTLTMVVVVLLLAVSCGTPMLEPAPTPESQVPPDFSTYTSEGLFTISYPPDWAPATSIMEEVWEASVEWMESVDPEAELEGTRLIFMAGIPTEEGYYPGVNTIVAPRSIGYWTVDEVVETESQWAREHTQRYQEFSTVETIVDGREAIIMDTQDYEPDMGYWRYLQLITVKGEFVWVVTCASESEDFKDYEDTFYDVVRSLRILN